MKNKAKTTSIGQPLASKLQLQQEEQNWGLTSHPYSQARKQGGFPLFSTISPMYICSLVPKNSQATVPSLSFIRC